MGSRLFQAPTLGTHGALLTVTQAVQNLAGPSYALGYVMFKNGNAKEKRNFMQAAANFALQSNHVKTVIVIARNIDEEDNLAYHAIYLFERLNDTPE